MKMYFTQIKDVMFFTFLLKRPIYLSFTEKWDVQHSAE